MKKQWKRTVLSLLVAVGLWGATVGAVAAADATVRFENGRLIATEPGSAWSDTDLFDGFKGMMPGDIRKQDIRIENDSKDCDYIKVYLKAVPLGKDGQPVSPGVRKVLKNDTRRGTKDELQYMKEFLAKLDMSVRSDGRSIYSGPADRTGDLAEGVLIGTLKRGEHTDCHVEMQLPVEADNVYADRIGEIAWEFVVEGYDNPTPPPEEKGYLTVRKVWKDDRSSDRPRQVTMELLKNGEPQGQVVLNDGNQWTYTWDRLDHKAEWTVREVDTGKGYDVKYVKEGHVITVINTLRTVTPSPKPPKKPQPVDLTVVKRWELQGTEQPESVKITLYNGTEAVETVLLNEKNGWTHTWKGLDGSGDWKVLESRIPKGFTPSYQVKDGTVIVTNTATLILTGQWKWPVPVLAGAGVVLILIGIVKRKKKRNR